MKEDGEKEMESEKEVNRGGMEGEKTDKRGRERERWVRECSVERKKGERFHELPTHDCAQQILALKRPWLGPKHTDSLCMQYHNSVTCTCIPIVGSILLELDLDELPKTTAVIVGKCPRVPKGLYTPIETSIYSHTFRDGDVPDMHTCI